MREYLFHGKRIDNGKWIEGMPCSDLKGGVDAIQSNVGGGIFDIYPESFGQYTGFNEWVLEDESHNAKLYEGDIIEVWGNRELYGSGWSQYDGKVKFRGVIVFRYGKWLIEFKNKYNETICKARGKEEYDREPPMVRDLYDPYFNHTSNKDEYRKRQLEQKERCLKWGFNDTSYYDDIVKIGNVFENADLLEG